MTYSVALVVILIAIHCSYCIPVNKEDCENPVTINLDATSVNEESSDVYKDTTTTIPVPCLISPQEEDETTTRADISSKYDGPSLMMPRESFEEADRGSAFQYLQPSIPLSPEWARSPYQVNPIDSLEAMGIGMGNQAILYPHAYSKLFAASNPEFSINSLPPVRSTYIHGMHYPTEKLQRTDYEIDVFNPQNAVFMPTLIRSGRMLRSLEDDFLAELSHAAIMNNVLPTMAVPFVRYAGSSVPYSYVSGEPGGGASIALYPNVASSGCNRPILFSCSPKIIHGSLKQKPSFIKYQLSSLGAHTTYKQRTGRVEN